MITNINYNWSYISFKNSAGKAISFKTLRFYDYISGFLQVDDGIICMFGCIHKPPSDEQARRNVVKINENGEIVWTVMDPLDIWRKLLPDNKEFSKGRYIAGFNSIYTCDNKIVLDACGPEYFLNPENGGIEFWRARRF